ncbi:MAG: hypothetical protein IJT00_11175 [Lachnospiraceae bacterium]|nr:hypothetical protein [Lachnospiraceae bacterium]
MRMTNKIMQNTSLYNMNNTKIIEDKYNTQMTTQSKITRPSDDPVVAIRALTLRTNVSQITQYNEKNAKDAESWLKVTDQALYSLNDVIQSIYEQATKGASQYNSVESVESIITEMEALTKEYYSTANADYAGRYVFSGYRTDTPVTFPRGTAEMTESERAEYKYTGITESFRLGDIDKVSAVDYSKLKDPANTLSTKESDITAYENYHRIRLAYDKVDDKVPTVEYVKGDGTKETLTIDATVYATEEEALKAAKNGGSDAYFCAETGELILSAKDGEGWDKLNKDLAENPDTDNTVPFLQVTYDKSSWDAGDLNPVHYFQCTDGKGVTYNQSTYGEYDPSTGTYTAFSTGSAIDAAVQAALLKAGGSKNTVVARDGALSANYGEGFYNDGTGARMIEYDVGYNQKIRVNTNAADVFSSSVARDMDDLRSKFDQYKDINRRVSELEAKLNTITDKTSADYKNYSNALDAANKACDYLKDDMKELFERQIERYQTYQQDCNVGSTENGTRMSRLEIIQTRLTSQQSTFRELADDNEGIDIAETAINLSSAQLTYTAALQATSKVIQSSLMDYI